MKSPFPGMDPYLEQYWRDVHASLVIYGRDQLREHLPKDLRCRVEERVYVEPEEGTETFLEIIGASSGNKVISVVEFLSPANKGPGDGRDKYLVKQKQMRDGGVNLVEIDLLRAGQRVFLIADSRIPPPYRTPYQVCVWRGTKPDKVEIYPVPLEQPLPAIRIPLRPTDQDAPFALQPLIEQGYRQGSYVDIDYRKDADPPLTSNAATWADDLLKKAGKRLAS